ncbi:MAG: 30S ribosome-binding factor RbfA [Eubacteriaceae bacterium]|nr:30S ribosome-binding factor RbfA [Eubacteriaceae bacterium]
MSYRVDRVNEEIKKELSRLIREEINDYRIKDKMISIVGVDCSADFKYAKVYISMIEGKQARDEAAAALNNAKGFLRKELGKVLKTYNTPQITFISDDTLEYGMKINELLKNIDKK